MPSEVFSFHTYTSLVLHTSSLHVYQRVLASSLLDSEHSVYHGQIIFCIFVFQFRTKHLKNSLFQAQSELRADIINMPWSLDDCRRKSLLTDKFSLFRQYYLLHSSLKMTNNPSQGEKTVAKDGQKSFCIQHFKCSCKCKIFSMINVAVRMSQSYFKQIMVCLCVFIIIYLAARSKEAAFIFFSFCLFHILYDILFFYQFLPFMS